MAMMILITTEAMYVVKNRPVKLIIGSSRDVIHDVGLSSF